MPARSGLTRFRSQNAGAWASAAMTATCAETSTRCPRPVTHRRLRDTHAHRLAVSLAGERHCAARRHDFQIGAKVVSVRSLLPERRDRDQNQRRVLFAQTLVAQAPPVERAGRETLDDEIRLPRQPDK